MSKELAVAKNELVVGQFTREELDTIKSTIAFGTTDAQFKLFVQTAVNSGLNPFLNHLYCIVYQSQKGPQMSIQFSVEGILYLARQKPDYKGSYVELVHDNDIFSYNGKTREITHEVTFPRGKVIGGYAIAKREGFEDVIVLMEASEVEHHKKGRNSSMWQNYFADMFKKHILKRAVKLQFGIDITEETGLDHASVDHVPDYRERTEVNNYQYEESSPAIEVKAEPTEDEKKLEAWANINIKTEQYGMKKSAVTDLIKEKIGKKPQDMSLADIVGLSKLIDLYHETKEESAPADDLDQELAGLGIE